MKKVLLLFSALVFACTLQAQQDKIAILPPADFQKSIMNDAQAIILDVRTPEEYAASRIENAILLDIKDSLTFDQGMRALSKDNHYYLYCKGGVRSHKAAQRMQQHGFQVQELEGGFKKWVEAHLPVWLKLD